MHEVSAPPPSPIPPPPDSPSERRRHPSLSGWRPADDDHTPRAVAWRAETALRRADRALVGQVALTAAVDKLSATIETWSETWGGRWATAGRILKWAAGIVGGAAVLGGARELWLWISTLHH